MSGAAFLRDITDDIADWVDRFEPASLDAYTIGGRVYGIPVSPVSTSSFFYNVDLFNELGLAEPDSYDDFIAVAAALDEAGYVPCLASRQERLDVADVVL